MMLDDNLAALLQESEVNPFADIEEPPYFLKIKGTPFGSFGNFSCITGKPKSGKTYFLNLIVSGVLGRTCSVNKMESKIPVNSIIHFDTEQSLFHAIKVARRTMELLHRKDSHPDYKCHCLRQYNFDMRLRLIEYRISSVKENSLVIIDGIADLISSYNDEKEASMIVGKLMTWSAERNIHIITVLHQNKNDTNAKGHLGSLILQKAETVLSVKKGKNYSEVSPSHSRGEDLDNLRFSIDEDGLPFFIEIERNDAKQQPSKNPTEFAIEYHKEVLKRVYESNESLNRNLLIKLIGDRLQEDKIEIGENKRRDWLNYYKEKGLITQSKTRGPYHLVDGIG